MSNFSSINSTKKEYGKVIEIVTIGVPVTTMIVNVPSIVLIIWIIARKEKVKNLHLLSIGITDTLVGISAYLMAETYLYTDKIFSYYNCWIRYYMFTLSLSASMLHVFGICAQRLKIVIRKTAVQNHRNFAWFVILASWTLSIIFNSIPFSIWTQDHDLTMCSLDTLFSGYEQMFSFYSGTVYGIITLLVVVTMSILSRLLWLRFKINSTNVWGYKDKRLFVTVCIMAVLFFVTITPLVCVLLSYDLLGENKRSQRSACVLISLLNSAINPIVYLFRVPEFTQILRKILLCGKCTNTVYSHNSQNRIDLSNQAS
ncbi:sphingosine 1-phosphate receptor 1-like [Mytilus edulis]|uniref:sphingosine 1-phosphate receptor 1-like n=1 Tax=Mytilus edulis TaxID=6550 RepID=UPI0039EDFB98